jgi:hypothetical protein
MNKREFLKAGLVATVAAQLPVKSQAKEPVAISKKKTMKNWVWINPNLKDTDEDLKNQLHSLQSSRYHWYIF